MTSFLRNLFRHLTYQAFSPGTLLRENYEAFKAVLERNKMSLELMAELEEIYHECRKVDLNRIQDLSDRLSAEVFAMVGELTRMSPVAYAELPAYCRKITFYVTLALETMRYDIKPPYVLALNDMPTDGESVAGGKAWRLALLRRELGIPAPDGFVATASACRYLIEANNLKQRIDAELARVDVHDAGRLVTAAARMTGMILQSEVPETLAREIREAARQFCRDGRAVRFAVRSSAVGEDGPISFAGQHESVLNVGVGRLAESYKRVIASKYSPKALHYRISNGLIDVDMPMAVLFMPLLPADTSGVIYTADPTGPSVTGISIHAVRGLGEALVSGTVSAERYDMTRDMEPRCTGMRPGEQHRRTIAGESEDLLQVTVDEAERSRPCLNSGECTALAKLALRIEMFFGGPMDIEWCRDPALGLMVLQARPLRLVSEPSVCGNPQPPPGVDIIIADATRAAGGTAAGPVFRLRAVCDIDAVPRGAILVARAASPDLSRITHRLAAAVFEVGSSAGHFASIARECGLPMLVQVHGALSFLRDGAVVTVDADCGAVYDGDCVARCSRQTCRGDQFLSSPFRAKVRKALDLISPLTLTDPESDRFAPEGCRTVHDIIRFCHERAMHEMFSLGRRGAGVSRGARRLRTDLPLVLYLLDISEGEPLCPGVRGDVEIRDIKHAGLRALWSGLSHPDIYWSPELLHIDWERLEQVTSGGIMSLDSPLLASFAILSHDYLNLSIRFGYHFAVVDSLCSETDGESYVLFSFKGGGSAHAGIMLRVLFLIDVLRHYGFKVSTRGDLVEAERAHCSVETALTLLALLGALLGCTRLLDYVLHDEASVGPLVQRFLAGDYKFAHLREGQAVKGVY